MADGSTNLPADDRGVAISRSGGVVEFWRPMIWSAIVGGTVVALGVQLILTLLGVGLGMAMIDPLRDAEPGRNAGIGAVVWLVVSGLISFGIGGWVAGHMSGVLRTGSGALHGVAAWALAAVLGAGVTALAGAPVLGGAAAGAGAAAPAAERYASTTTAGAPTPAGGAAGAVADSLSTAAGVSPAGRSAPGATGRPMTEAEARQAADDARRAMARASLWTGVAFLLSMIAAGVGGTIGRKSPAALAGDHRSADSGSYRGAQPAI